MGEVAVRDLPAGGMVEQLEEKGCGWLFPVAVTGGTRTIGQEAGAEGRNSLYDEDLVSRDS